MRKSNYMKVSDNMIEILYLRRRAFRLQRLKHDARLKKMSNRAKSSTKSVTVEQMVIVTLFN